MHLADLSVARRTRGSRQCALSLGRNADHAARGGAGDRRASVHGTAQRPGRRRETVMGTQRQDAWIGLALFVAGAMLALIISSAAPRAQGSAQEPAKPDQIVVNDS